MPLMTPPLHAKGVYTLSAPWAVVPGAIYECIAVRSFADFVEVGQNAYELFYRGVGLLEADFEADKALGASIITLASPSRPTIHVPDTYITTYPDMGNVAYKSVVFSVAVGPLPDSLDLAFLQSQLEGIVSDVIGVIPVVKLHAAPSTGVVSATEAAAMEVARLAAVTMRTTDRAKVLALQAQVSALQDKLAGIEQYLKDNDLIPD